MTHRLLFYVPLASLALLAACDTLETQDPDFEPEYVVESYQIAQESLQPIRLSRTADVDGTYDFKAGAVRGAAVTMNLLGEDGRVEATFAFAEQGTTPGVYTAVDQHRLLPRRTYRLDVTTPNDDRITALTVVPDTFRLVRTNLDTVVYQSSEQFEVTVTRSFVPGRQNVFIFGVRALEPRYDQLTPFAAAIFDEDEDNLDDFATGSSPLINEANYEIDEAANTVTIAFPWLAVAFYGPSQLTANVVDDNIYDFIRSQQVQQGGSTFSPGEIPNVLERVQGGHGVFGSLARSITRVYIQRP